MIKFLGRRRAGALLGAMILLMFSMGSHAKEKVVFQVIWGSGVHFDQFAMLVDEFNRTSETVEVELRPGTPPAGVYVSRLLAEVAAGIPPDVFVAGIDVPRLLVEGELLVDVSETRLAELLPRDEYLPVMQENMMYGDRWYTIPWFIDNTFLIYSRSLFAEVGLDSAVPPETWDELQSMGQKFVRGDESTPINERRYGLLTGAVGANAARGWNFLPWAWQAGGRLFDPETNHVTLDDPGIVKALTFLKEGVQESRFIAHPEVDNTRLITSGNVAMWQALPQQVDSWERMTGEKPGTSMLPSDQEIATQIGGWHIYILDTDRKEASIEFVSWLTRLENQARYVAGTRAVPPRHDIIRSDIMRDHLETYPEMWPLMDQAPYARAVHPGLRRAPIAGINPEGALAEAIDAVVRGHAPVELALEHQQELLSAAFRAAVQSETE